MVIWTGNLFGKQGGTINYTSELVINLSYIDVTIMKTSGTEWSISFLEIRAGLFPYLKFHIQRISFLTFKISLY